MDQPNSNIKENQSLCLNVSSRQRLNEKVVKNLINLFCSQIQLSNQQIANRTNISMNRIYYLRKQYFETGTIRPTITNKRSLRKQKRNRVSREILFQIIHKNPYISVNQLRNLLISKNISIQLQKIPQILKRQNYYYRRLNHCIPLMKNTVDIVEKRYQFVKQNINNQQDSKLFFIGETIFNLKINSYYGWVQIGGTEFPKIPQTSQAVIAITLVNVKGIISYFLRSPISNTQIKGSRQEFKSFLNKKLNKEAILMIQDFASPYLRELIQQINIQSFKKTMPEYSPQLNPLKLFYTDLKSQLFNMRIHGLIKNMEKLIQVVQQFFKNNESRNFIKQYKKMRVFSKIALEKATFENHL